jgi:hypothetical protein
MGRHVSPHDGTATLSSRGDRVSPREGTATLASRGGVQGSSPLKGRRSLGGLLDTNDAYGPEPVTPDPDRKRRRLSKGWAMYHSLGVLILVSLFLVAGAEVPAAPRLRGAKRTDGMSDFEKALSTSDAGLKKLREEEVELRAAKLRQLSATNAQQQQAVAPLETRRSLWPDPRAPPASADELIKHHPAEVSRQQMQHLVFSTGCEKRHDIESLGTFFTARRSMPYANVTRLISCGGAGRGGSSAEDAHVFSDPVSRAVGQSWLVPPRAGGRAGRWEPHVRASAIESWLTGQAGPTEDTIVILDPDTVLLRPLDLGNLARAEELRGHPVSAYGAHEEDCWGMLQKMLQVKAWPCPECKSLLAQKGKGQLRAVQGAMPPHVVHRADLAKLAPRWRYYTDAMRKHLPQEPSELADLCGWGLAAAETGLEQELRTDWVVSDGCAFGKCGKHETEPNPLLPEASWNSPQLGWDNGQAQWKRLPVALNYRRPRYQIGLKYEFSKVAHPFIYDDVLECGRRFLMPPPSWSPEENSRNWFLSRVLHELNQALAWYGEQFYASRESECLSEQARWAAESYVPHFVLRGDKAGLTAAHFYAEDHIVPTIFLYRQGFLKELGYRANVTAAQTFADVFNKTVDALGGGYFQEDGPGCAEHDGVVGDNAHCGGLTVEAAALACDQHPDCAAFAVSDRGTGPNAPTTDKLFRKVHLSARFYSRKKMRTLTKGFAMVKAGDPRDSIGRRFHTFFKLKRVEEQERLGKRKYA